MENGDRFDEDADESKKWGLWEDLETKLPLQLEINIVTCFTFKFIFGHFGLFMSCSH